VSGQGVLIHADADWPANGASDGWTGVARGSLLWLQGLFQALSQRPPLDWGGIVAGAGQPGARDLTGGISADWRVAHRFDFDGYSASDEALIWSPSGPYTVAVVARGDDGGSLADLSVRLADYFQAHTWAAPDGG
jgi:hypothetical protein